MMKIIYQDNQKIVIQREELVNNLDLGNMIQYGFLMFIALLTLSPESITLDCDGCFWIPSNDLRNPLFIVVTWFGIIVGVSGLFLQLWQAFKSPTQKRYWDRYVFDKQTCSLTRLEYKWSQPKFFGNFHAISNLEIVVDIHYRNDVNDPESVDTSPESVYSVNLIFADGQQASLEHNAIPLVSSEKVQEEFRTTISETVKVVADLKHFLELPI